MDDGGQDEKLAAEAMKRAREAIAVAKLAGEAGDRGLRLAAISEALNASGAAVSAIETWRLSLLAERQKMRGEPLDFDIRPVGAPSSGSKH